MEGYLARIVTSFIEIPGMICSSVYFTGCTFGCPGCQNPELQNMYNGASMSVDEVIRTLEENKLVSWVCFLGGEPFNQPEFLFNICQNIHLPVGIYTGNDFEELQNHYQKILDLQNVKFLKTGRFVMDLIKDIEFPITSNQKVYLKKNEKWSVCHMRDIPSIASEIKKF